MAKATRQYSAKLQFPVVLEALRGEKTPGQIAKAYGVHPNSIGLWKKMFLERGAVIFEHAAAEHAWERRLAEVEQLVGRKELEIVLLKNFLGRSA